VGTPRPFALASLTAYRMAKHKQQIAQKAKKNAQIRQKEAQKAEADSLSRKHLAGLRVVQKNLVYVTGLTPTIREDRLLDTLRGPDYFGQYGKIIKIVVSKARENAQHQQSVGVYVTFARKDDAEACITAVDGSQNGERVLRYVSTIPLTFRSARSTATGRNTARRSTAQPIFAASSATIVIACSFTNPGKTTRASRARTCR
jgi:RNA recognition motif-containing protein